MPDSRADEALKLQSRYEMNRGIWDQHYREVARLVWPMMNRFQQDRREYGQKRTQFMFEATAPLAKDRYASVFLGFMAPEDDHWHTLVTTDQSLNRLPAVSNYLDEVSRILFKVRYDPKAGFSKVVEMGLKSLACFGTGFGHTDRSIELGSGQVRAGFSYRAPALADTYMAENSNGRIDTIHHKPYMTVRQIIQRYGQENLHPNMLRQAANNPEQEFWVLHRAAPNPDFRPGALGRKGMEFESLHVDIDNRHILRHSGTRTLRYSVARAPSAPGEVYGRGPAMTILPEIKTINEMRRGMLRAQHRALTPAILLHSKKAAPLRLTPNAMNFGMLDDQGRALAAPFNSGAQYEPAEVEMERIREIINTAFHNDLLRILIDDPRETATKTLERKHERALMVGPQIGQIQQEFLGNMIESELELGEEMGIFPEMPEELREAAGEVEIRYQNDITRAQQLGIVESVEEWKQRRAIDAEMGHPEGLDVLDWEGYARFDGMASGIPNRFILDEDTAAENREQRNALAAQQAQLDQAEQEASTAKTAAEAAQVANQPVL